MTIDNVVKWIFSFWIPVVNLLVAELNDFSYCLLWNLWCCIMNFWLKRVSHYSLLDIAAWQGRPKTIISPSHRAIVLADSIAYRTTGFLRYRPNPASNVCRVAYFHIRALRHIRLSLTEDMAISMAVSMVHSRLDYANSLVHGHTNVIAQLLWWSQ